ncbi:MAG: MFS transporter [Chloroflexota bacterium]
MQTNRKILVLGLACASFLALGILTAALGPALPDLAHNTNASLVAAGSMFTALFLGSLAAQTLAGPGLDRLGPRPILLVGFVLLGAGTFGLSLLPWLGLALAGAVVAGLGHGAIDVTSNVMAAELFPERRAMALNLLNLFFGIGAFLGPALAGLTLRMWGTALPSLWLGAGLLLALLPWMARWTPASRASAQPGSSQAARRGRLASPLLWALGLMILVYVGIENGTGGWTPVYLARTTPLSASSAALVTSGFWLAITAGRGVATLLGARLHARWLLAGSLGLALVGSLLLAAGRGSPAWSAAGVMVLGLGFGPVFPTTLALVTVAFPGAAGAAAGVVVALGSLGGMLLPWVQGLLLEQVGPAGSLALTSGACLLMLLLYAVAGRVTPRETAGGAAAADPAGQPASRKAFPARG